MTILGYAVNSFCTFSKSPDLEASKSSDSKSKITGGSKTQHFEIYILTYICVYV